MNCAHYEGRITRIRHSRYGERYRTPSKRTAVCDACGVCLGWLSQTRLVNFNPILNDAQKHAVRVFFFGKKGAYQREYYERVTKPKREAVRVRRLQT